MDSHTRLLQYLRHLSRHLMYAASDARHGLVFYFDICAKFHRSIFIKGWCCRRVPLRKPIISAIECHAKALSGQSWRFIPDLPHLQSFASGFDIQLLLDSDEFPEDLRLVFHVDSVEPVEWSWGDIIGRVQQQRERTPLVSRFREILRQSGAAEMLDVGGRARSGVLKASEYPNMNIQVLDILPGEGVTVVCDAHRMSSVLGQERFDAVTCVSVFEHLLMPWKVAVEMNRVMKHGAVAFIHTHQTIGMHDMPWDFFRFSDTAWKGLFNPYTGFEILGTEMEDLHYIIPFVWQPRYRDAEKSAGFESSAVLVRKISDATVDWPIAADQVTADMYPESKSDRIATHAVAGS